MSKDKFYIYLATNIEIEMIANTPGLENNWCTGSSQVSNAEISHSTASSTHAVNRIQ